MSETTADQTSKAMGTIRAGSNWYRDPLILLIACAALALFALAYPFYVIRPFRPQGIQELSLALAVMRFRPWLEAPCLLIAVVTFALVWPKAHSLRRRTSLAIATLIVVACCFLSRVNIYERMFHPLDQPVFAAASKVKLDNREEVLAVSVNHVARAYPIRILSYHHIVNDVLAGLPIVATY